MDPFHGVAAVLRLQVHANRAGATRERGDHGSARTDEGVQDYPAGRATTVQTALHELDGIRGEVRARIVGPGYDFPDILFADEARPVRTLLISWRTWSMTAP